MRFQELTEENYLLYAIKEYDNPTCKGMAEFQEDISRIIYIKRLIKKYTLSKDLKERLILNHLIIFYNVFGTEAATRILFLKLESDLHSCLRTFLVYLQYIKPDSSHKEWGLDLIRIPLDLEVVKKLRKI